VTTSRHWLICYMANVDAGRRARFVVIVIITVTEAWQLDLPGRWTEELKAA